MPYMVWQCIEEMAWSVLTLDLFGAPRIAYMEDGTLDVSKGGQAASFAQRRFGCGRFTKVYVVFVGLGKRTMALA